MSVSIITAFIIAAFWGLECIVFPRFIIAQWPEKCKKSFCLKVISATVFVAYGVFAYFATRSLECFIPKFALYMVIGLIGGWFGDVLLHLQPVLPVKSKTVDGGCFVLGLLAFLAGHIFYVLAYIEGLHAIGVETIPVWSWVAVAVLFVMEAVIAVVSPIKLGIAVVPVALYALTISTMLSMAVTLAIYYAKYSIFACVMLIAGAVLFVISDGTLVFNLFGGDKFKKSYSLKIVNLTTYFIGQMLLGSTIFLINSCGLV